MEQFGERLGALQGQGRQDVGVQKLTLGHPPLGQPPDSVADGGDEHADIVDLSAAPGQQVVRQAEAVPLGLAAQIEFLGDIPVFRTVDQNALAVGVAGEEFQNRVGLDVFLGQHQVFHFSDGITEFDGRLVSSLQVIGEPALVTKMPNVEHLWVDERENLLQGMVLQNVQPQVRRVGDFDVVPHLGRGHVFAGRGFIFPGRFFGGQHGFGFLVQRGHQLGPFVGVLDGIGQRQP